MVKCRQCRNVFHIIGDALNAQLDTTVLLETAAESIVEEFNLKACHFRLLSRDLQTLDDVASHGLSEAFLNKGPVDAEKSVAAALQGEIVMVTDSVSDPRVQYPEAFEAEGIVSMLTIPLKARGQVIGVMRLFTASHREFSDDEIEFFKVVALFCTSAIIDSMFRMILANVTEAIRTSLDLQVVLDAIVKTVCEDLRTRGCVIQLIDGPKSQLETRASFGLGEAFVGRMSGVCCPQLVEQVLGGRCVAVLDGRKDDRIAHPDELAREGISSLLLVPLETRGKPIGILSLFTNNPYAFSDDEKQLMMTIGEQCALAIDNAMMFAALKRRYETLVDDFNLWFEHSQSYPQRGSRA
ncbi:GAF domain-containing protein [Acidobacteriota bacterium]